MRPVRDEWTAAEVVMPVFDRMAELRSRYVVDRHFDEVRSSAWIAPALDRSAMRRAVIRHDRWLWGLLGIIFVAGVSGTVLALILREGLSLATYLLTLSLVLLLFLRVRMKTLCVATPADLVLDEETADAEAATGNAQWLVELRLKGFDKKIEVDRGVLWFEQDAMLYCGHRCSFVLGVQDFARWWTRPRIMIDLPRDRGHVEIRYLSITGKDATYARRQLERAVATFAVTAKSTTLQREYPPEPI